MVQLNRLIERLSDAGIDLSDLRPRHRFASPKHSFLDNPEAGVALNNLYLETELGPIDLLGNHLHSGMLRIDRTAMRRCVSPQSTE